MSTSVNGTSGSSGTSADSMLSTNRSSLGQDAFLQLLTTQLANQDPTNPQDNSEMIAQLAQFSSLEQLTQVNKTLQAISTALGVVTTGSGSSGSGTGTGNSGTTGA